MIRTSDGYTGYKLAVFDSTKVELQIRTNPTRALAINEIVDRLIATDLTPLNEARQAWRRGSPSHATHIIRQLKHSVINFGAMRVCDIATDIEELLAMSPFDDKFELFMQAFETELTLFLERAKDWRKQQLKELGQHLQQTGYSFAQTMQELMSLLNQNNMRALDVYDALRDQLSEGLTEDCLQKIDECVNQLNFGEVIRLLEGCDTLAPLNPTP